MIALSTLVFVGLVWSAYRRAAWGVAFLGLALGTMIAGPVGTGVTAVLDAIEALLTAIGKLV